MQKFTFFNFLQVNNNIILSCEMRFSFKMKSQVKMMKMNQSKLCWKYNKIMFPRSFDEKIYDFDTNIYSCLLIMLVRG
jgi:hypothetical protein